MEPHAAALAAYLLAAMQSWVPEAQHDYRAPPEVTHARYEAIAGDIAEVALEPDQAPIFAGEDGRGRTALLVASIAGMESFYRSDADSCEVGGDGGISWGLFQTQKPKVLVCSDRKVMIRIAIGMARDSFRDCRANKLEHRLAEYTDGTCSPKANRLERSYWRVMRAVWWAKKHQLPADAAASTDS